MSVLINGMKMPKEGCRDCLLVKRGHVFDICPFLKRAVNGNVERGGKPYGCPLIELPDHGDLIDRDEAADDACLIWGRNSSGDDAAQEIIEHLRKMEAVIPAERSGE